MEEGECATAASYILVARRVSPHSLNTEAVREHSSSSLGLERWWGKWGKINGVHTMQQGQFEHGHQDTET